MFCPNCGNQVQASDNYCPRCGQSLRKVKIQIVDEEQTKKPLSQETITFKPLKNITNIDTTDELKNIIKAVDEKISKNISEYEKKTSLPQDSEGPLVDKTNDVEDLSKENKIKFNKNKLDTPIDKSENKLNLNKKSLKDSSDLQKEKINEPAEKRGFVQKFKEFINEDNDEFSIFSSFDEPTVQENIELTQPEPKHFEDTMDVPPIKLDDLSKHNEDINKLNSNDPKIKKSSYDYKSFTDLVNSELEKSKNSNISNSIDDVDNIKSDKPENIFLKLKSKFSKSSNSSEKVFEKPEKKSLASTVKSKDLKNSNLDDLNKSDKIIEKKDANIINDTKNKNKSNLSDSLDKSVKKEDVLLKNDNTDSKKNTEGKTNTILPDKLLSILNKINLKIQNIPEKYLLPAGIFFTVFPVAISMYAWNKISIALLFLLVIKVVIKLSQFYIPLNVAIEKAWIDSSAKEVRHYAIINYVLCEIIMLVMFIFSPWYGWFNFNTLSALTAFPVATIILVLFSTILAVSQFKDRLNKSNKIDFIGWYMILFIIFEFIGKLIFMFTDILI